MVANVESIEDQAEALMKKIGEKMPTIDEVTAHVDSLGVMGAKYAKEHNLSPIVFLSLWSTTGNALERAILQFAKQQKNT